MKDKIAELLMMEFCHVHCYNCAYHNEKTNKADTVNGCFMCDKNIMFNKNVMNWELSINEAKRIAENIDELYKKQEQR